MRRLLPVLLLVCLLPFAVQAQECLKKEKNYNSSTFDPEDFLADDQGINVGNDLILDTSELDLENLVLGLEQPFYVDYLSEGAGASHLFGFFFLDIDTDKDGFPDFLEVDDNSDLDGDGLLNSEDDDDDGDGILDINDTVPSGVTSMDPSLFRNGTEAAANSISGKAGTPDYWQFVPNSVLTEGTYSGYFEHPGAYLYVDNNNDDVPDVLEYVNNHSPPYVTDKDYTTTHAVAGGDFLGQLGNDFTYQGTPGENTSDKYHWTGSTIFYIADDDGSSSQTSHYNNYLPYKDSSGNPLYADISGSTDANVDYLIYGTTDAADSRIPSVLVDEADDGTRTFKTDDRGQQMYKYRWFESSISGAREIVFFLTVFWGSGGSNVNTYYSKSAFNPDTPPSSASRNGSTTGDQFGRDDALLTGGNATNWFPVYRNNSEHDDLAVRVWGVDDWEDIATRPSDGSSPVLKTGGDLKNTAATQAWVDEWENITADRRIIQYRALADWFNQTSVNANDIVNGRYGIDMTAEGDSSIIRASDGRMVHLMVGAPKSTKDAWLLGWEDLFGGGDRDYEDVVFYVKRAAGGELVSLNVADDIGIGASSDAEFSISQVNFSFEDNFTDDQWGTEGRYIAYFYRLSQNDEWTPLLGGNPPANQHHLREVDKFQPEDGGTTVVQDDGSVLRTVSIPVTDRKTELYWKVQMADDNVDSGVSPTVLGAVVGYQSLIHDFYYNSAVIPNSNINYFAAHETPRYSWNEQRNRGHIYAFQTFVHGNPLTSTKIGDDDSNENFPDSQPVAMWQKDTDSDAINLFKWDAGVSMLQDLQDGNKRTIYSYVTNNGATLRNDLEDDRVVLDPEETNLDSSLVNAFEFTDDKTIANVWVDNYHAPAAETRDENAAALWLINWIHGQENPIVSDVGLESSAELREWVLGGINRASPLVIRAPGRPLWLDRSAEIPVTDKRSYLLFAEQYADMDTRLLIGAESGLIHCIDAGQWIGEVETDDDTDEEYAWAEGHYKDENYGTGKESWAMLPGHLLPDIKNNYTGADDIVAQIDASAVATVIKDGNDWKRIAVFTQGYRGGKQTISGSDRIGNVIFALDITDIDDPLPMWHRSDVNTQDIINPVSMGWMEIGTDNHWVVVYPSGGTPVDGRRAAFRIVDATNGNNLRNRNVGTSGTEGTVTLLGTPSLLDTDANGYIDHVFCASSQGRLLAYNTKDNNQRAVLLDGPQFWIAPNIDLDADGNVKVVAVSGDSPLTYDQADTVANTIYYYKYIVATRTWEEVGTIALPLGHKVFSRPKLIDDQLVVGTTTGDTFNFCDADPEEPGSLLLYDLTKIGTDEVLEYQIEDYGSVLAPIIVSDGRVLAHGSSMDKDKPNKQGSILGNRQEPNPDPVTSFSIADIFGVNSWQDDLIQALKDAQESLAND